MRDDAMRLRPPCTMIFTLNIVTVNAHGACGGIASSRIVEVRIDGPLSHKNNYKFKENYSYFFSLSWTIS